MLFRSKPGWEMPERDATPESVFQDRRRLAQALAAGPLLLGAAPALSLAANAAETDPSAGLYPAKRNERYKLDRELTDERIVTTDIPASSKRYFGPLPPPWMSSHHVSWLPGMPTGRHEKADGQCVWISLRRCVTRF